MRPPNWPQLLQDHIRRFDAVPFEWGKADCSIYTSVWMATCGLDVSFLIGKKWTTEKSAYAVLEKLGGFEKAVERAGGVPIKIPFAQRGDVAMLKVNKKGDPAMGIIVDSRVSFKTKSGVGFAPIKDYVLAVWRI